MPNASVNHRARMLRVTAAAAALALAVSVLPAQQVQPVQFLTNYDTALAAAQKYGYPILIFCQQSNSDFCRKMEKEVFADKRVIALCRSFVPLKVDANAPIANKHGVIRIPTLLFIDPTGTKIDELVGYGPPDLVLKYMTPLVEKTEQKVLELCQAQLTSKNTSTAAAALTRIGQLNSRQAEEVVLAQLRREDAPDAIKRAALEALGRRGSSVEEIIPYLTHKSTALQSAAAAALQAMGPAAVTPLLEGLGSEFADRRAACHRVAVAISKYTKGKSPAFWKSGPEAERGAALEEWKKWWADQPRPDLAKPKS